MENCGDLQSKPGSFKFKIILGIALINTKYMLFKIRNKNKWAWAVIITILHFEAVVWKIVETGS